MKQILKNFKVKANVELVEFAIEKDVIDYVRDNFSNDIKMLSKN